MQITILELRHVSIPPSLDNAPSLGIATRHRPIRRRPCHGHSSTMVA